MVFIVPPSRVKCGFREAGEGEGRSNTSPIKALKKATDPEKARRLTRDLHACRLHLRSLEFEAAARERLC